MGRPDSNRPSDVVLAHYGVKGMTWGKRKARKAEAEARKSADHKEVQTLRKKPISEMSNKEIKKLNERMNLEKNYKKLLEEQPKELTRGQKAVKGVKLTYKIATDVNDFMKSPMGRFVYSAVMESMNVAMGGSGRTPGPGNMRWRGPAAIER